MADLKIKIGDAPMNEDKPSTPQSCEELLNQLEQKIASDYPDVAEEAQPHLDALRELTHPDDSPDYSKDVADMAKNPDSMSELMNS